MNLQSATLVMITSEELSILKTNQQEILRLLNELHIKGPGGIPVKNITAKEFMAAVRICRTKFDQLVATNSIRIIKKKRKIYVPFSEVERYFVEPGI